MIKPCVTYISFVLTLFCYNSGNGQTNKIELNLFKGQSFIQSSASDVITRQGIKEKETTSTMLINCNIKYSVTDVSNSIYSINATYQKYDMRMLSANKAIIISSELPEKNPVSKTLSTLKGKSFQFKITKSGKIIEVKNTQSLYLGLYDQVPNISEVQKSAIKTLTQQSYEEKNFIINLENSFSVIPNHPVKVGDTWAAKRELESTISINLDVTYKLVKVTADYYLISCVSKIIPQNPDIAKSINGVSVKNNLAGTVLSTLKISKKTGLVIEMSSKQNLSGTTHIESKMLPIPLNIPLSTTGNTRTIITSSK